MPTSPSTPLTLRERILISLGSPGCPQPVDTGRELLATLLLACSAVPKRAENEWRAQASRRRSAIARREDLARAELHRARHAELIALYQELQTSTEV